MQTLKTTAPVKMHSTSTGCSSLHGTPVLNATVETLTFVLLALCAASAFAQNVKLVKKPLVTPIDLSLYAGVLATRSLDYVTTERLLDRGGRELLLPSGLVHSKPAFAAFSLGSGAAEIYTARRLAKHHPKLARYVLAVDIGAAGAVAGHNAAILPKPLKGGTR